jgi:hypothetical protein
MAQSSATLSPDFNSIMTRQTSYRSRTNQWGFCKLPTRKMPSSRAEVMPPAPFASYRGLLSRKWRISTFFVSGGRHFILFRLAYSAFRRSDLAFYLLCSRVVCFAPSRPTHPSSARTASMTVPPVGPRTLQRTPAHNGRTRPAPGWHRIYHIASPAHPAGSGRPRLDAARPMA